MRLRVLGEIAQRDVLPVAREVGEADGVLVEHPQEARRPAAMLDVGLALRVGGRQKDAGLGLDEGSEFGRDGGLPGAALLHARIGRRANPCGPASP